MNCDSMFVSELKFCMERNLDDSSVDYFQEASVFLISIIASPHSSTKQKRILLLRILNTIASRRHQPAERTSRK